MNLRIGFIFFLLQFALVSVSGQINKDGDGVFKRYFDKLLNDTNDLSAPKFMTYPTLAYSPETRWEIGFSSLYIYSAKRDLLNRLSEVKAFTFYTLENQYGIWLDHMLYTDKNTWFFLGRARYQSFPLLYFGIGPDSQSERISLIDGNYSLFRERFLRAVIPSLYVGLELDYQRLSSVKYKDVTPNHQQPSVGANGSTNLGLGLGILYDNIHNALNPRKGIYSEWVVLNYNRDFGSDFNFTSYITDNRFYVPVKKNTVLAAQLYGQFTLGNAPFNMLSLMGGESLMRGYYLGRYRDKNLIAGQLEYRILPFKFSKRWGASAFMAAGQVYDENETFQFKNLLPTGGLGLRFLVFPEKDIYTRIDVAFTEEGRGIYFFIGEAF
ncbi:MAG: BamA/TamA family outer membrane protein [Bacteroidota bacterium]|nr:BamA/TamA family outer membrane protein [Bacteroidota bacterium]